MSFVVVDHVHPACPGQDHPAGRQPPRRGGRYAGRDGPERRREVSLLRIINMLDRPDLGTVRINGKDVADSDRLELQRSMAMVFQKPIPFSMNVYDNVAYGMRLRRAPANPRSTTAVRDALRRLDMEGKERQYARSLSGGEAQRLAFARAYVLKPPPAAAGRADGQPGPGERAHHGAGYPRRQRAVRHHGHPRDTQHVPGSAPVRSCGLHDGRRGHRDRADGAPARTPVRSQDGEVRARGYSIILISSIFRLS